MNNDGIPTQNRKSSFSYMSPTVVDETMKAEVCKKLEGFSKGPNPKSVKPIGSIFLIVALLLTSIFLLLTESVNTISIFSYKSHALALMVFYGIPSISVVLILFLMVRLSSYYVDGSGPKSQVSSAALLDFIQVSKYNAEVRDFIIENKYLTVGDYRYFKIDEQIQIVRNFHGLIKLKEIVCAEYQSADVFTEQQLNSIEDPKFQTQAACYAQSKSYRRISLLITLAIIVFVAVVNYFDVGHSFPLFSLIAIVSLSLFFTAMLMFLHSFVMIDQENQFATDSDYHSFIEVCTYKKEYVEYAKQVVGESRGLNKRDLIVLRLDHQIQTLEWHRLRNSVV